MRFLAGLIALFTLAACGEPEPQVPVTPLPTDPSAQVRVYMQTSRMSPDWISIARQRDCTGQEDAGERCPYGEVYYNKNMITRSVDGSIANIWVQTDHGAPQLFQGETESSVITVRYTRTRLHYRFNCADDTFTIVERQILGSNDTVLQSINPPEIFREPQRWSAVAIAMPIACDGGELRP
jgi:hypothetical protein